MISRATRRAVGSREFIAGSAGESPRGGHGKAPLWIDHASRPWHFLYFLPEPHGHGSLRPTLASATKVPWRSPGRRPDSAASNASITTSVGLMIVDAVSAVIAASWTSSASSAASLA